MPIRPSSLGSREPDYSPGVSVGLVVVSLFNVHLPCDQFMFITNMLTSQTGCIHLLGLAADHLPVILSTAAAIFAFQVFKLSPTSVSFGSYGHFLCDGCRWLASVLPAAWGAQTGSPPGSNTEPLLLCETIF